MTRWHQHWPFLVCVSAGLVTGCSGGASNKKAPTARYELTSISQEEIIMNRVEASVALPSRAHKISDYARYYTYTAPGHVKARFVIPFPIPGPSVGCVNGAGVACSEREKQDLSDRIIASHGVLQPGQRRWIKEERDLPSIFDGGCDQITITFSIATDRVESANCNGPR